MEGINHPWIVGIATGLIVAFLTFALGWLLRGEQYRRRVDAAPTKFIARLTELIEHAVKEGPEHARVNARAILAMRDSFRRHSLTYQNCSIPRWMCSHRSSIAVLFIVLLLSEPNNRMSRSMSPT